MRENLAKMRVGLVNKNTYGSLFEIVEYNKNNDIWVKFLEHGNLVHTQWTKFCDGQVKNVYDKSINGVGYIGEGDYKVIQNGKPTPQYNSWWRMMRRCYDEKALKRNPTYMSCSVSEEWHNFQTFAKWWDENYYHIEGANATG